MKQGFTLIEMLIAMTLSSFIFLVVSSLLMTVITSNTKGRYQEVFEQAKNDLSVELTNSIKWGKVIICTRCDGNLSNSTLDVDGALYELKDNKILKSGAPMTPKSISVKAFKIAQYSGSVTPSFNLDITMEAGQSGNLKDRLNFVVTNRKQAIQK